MENREASREHLAFAVSGYDGCEVEFYLRAGQIHMAPVSAPVMPDGYRCGRWEGPATAAYMDHLEAIWDVRFPRMEDTDA